MAGITARRADPRAALLESLRGLLQRRGRLADLSLRAIAQELGSSHRMLIYHFGSRDGLLAALLHDQRVREQAAIREAAATGGREAAFRYWESAYLDTDSRPRFGAFFYVLGLAVQDPDAYREFLDSLDDWIAVFAELGTAEGLTPDAARTDAQILVWTTRGLLVNALATGDQQRLLTDLAAVLDRLGVTGPCRAPAAEV